MSAAASPRVTRLLSRIGQYLLLCATLLFPCAQAAGNTGPETIEWYMIDLPPIQISSGELRGRGYTDVIRWRLIANLPEYRHILRIANVQRILADIRTKPNVCNPAFMRTPERETYMVFAEPLHAQFPNGAAFLRERRDELEPFITPDGSLAVDELVEHGKGTIAVQSGRSYGVVLDGLVEMANSHHRVITLSSNRPVESKLGLVQRGRAELALLYPYELAFHLTNSNEDPTRYGFLPVEGNGIYTLNHLACSKSPLGEKLVADATPIIQAERDAYFSAAYREWVPESILELHEAHHFTAFQSPLKTGTLQVPALDDAIATCLMDGGAWYRGRCEADYQRPADQD